jgi:hypothetical protein
MSKIEESLNQVSLKLILTKSELNILKSNPLFKNAEENEFYFDKNELLLKFVSLAIEKFKELKDVVLTKCFNWVKNELKMDLDLKPDAFSLNKIEKLENSKPSMKVKLGWLKEYSSLSKENHLISMLGKSVPKLFHRYSALEVPKMFSFNAIKEVKKVNARKRKSLNEEFSSNNLLMRLNLGNDSDLNLESPEFNIFEFEKKIGKQNVLPAISVYVFNYNELFDLIPYNKFERFVYEISQGYHRENPYHTDLHAADMLQSIFVYKILSKFNETLHLLDMDILSMFISAIIHDYGHPGLNNNYLIKTKDDLAIKYNDISVLENYHVSAAFKIMLKKPENNIFDEISEDDFKLCRKNIIECVLGTDMTLHNKKYLAFKRRLQTENIKKGENINNLFNNLDPIHSYNLKLEFQSFIIHAADISNPTKPLEIYKEWAQRCVDEFFKQGDLEKKLGMPISFNCDRNTVSLSQSQLGFIDVIVSPLFTVLNEYFPQLSFTLDNIKTNYNYYKSIKDEEKKDKENRINS